MIRAAITKTELRQRVEVLTRAGLGIAAIKPDGTIIIGQADRPDLIRESDRGQDDPDAALEKWLENAKG